MGRKLHYRPGSFYRTDDRTGFPQRAERTRKEWTGAIVDERVWEPRQPQDLVRGVPDKQSVPEPRPLGPNQYVGPTYATLADSVGPGATVLTLDSVGGFASGTSVGVILGDGSVFMSTVSGAPGASTITLSAPLPQAAPEGNLVANYTETISV